MMLSKIFDNLKNTIFLKAFIYLLLIIALFKTISIYKKELTNTIYNKQKATNNLTHILNKLDSIKNISQNIPKISTELQKVKNKIYHNRSNLTDNTKKLLLKYNLPEKIEIKKTVNADNNKNLLRNELDIKFIVSDSAKIVDIIEDILLLFSDLSRITFIEFYKIDTLSPSLIKKLSTNKTIGLYQVHLKIEEMELIYE